jgi:glycosyltransferase involved in cell wall biosynthesis
MVDAALMREVMEGRRRLILFVGNLVPIKGPDVFMESLSLLQSSAFSPQPTVSVIIGEGPLRRSLERRAKQLGLGDSVVFLGRQPHTEVARWMNVADVLCLTSRSEGMPNVVIEALVSGLPVVVTDVGACRELVADEPLARWCLSEDTQALARAMRDLLTGHADRAAMAARHAPRYSWAQQARRILGLMGKGAPAEAQRTL